MSNLLLEECEEEGLVPCALVSLSSLGSLAALSILGPMMSFEGILSMSPKNQGSREVCIHFNCGRLLQKSTCKGGKKRPRYYCPSAFHLNPNCWAFICGKIGKIHLTQLVLS